MLNETFWAGGVAILMQCYSVRGLNVVAAMNISNTISNLFNVVFIALGDSVAIIVGQAPRSRKDGKARYRYEADHVFRITLHCDRRADGARGSALPTPLQHDGRSTPHGGNLHRGSGHVHAGQCIPACKLLTLRSGGKTIITFLFDSVFIWVVSVPVAFCLSRFTGLSIYAIYFMVMSVDLIKCVIGFVLVKKRSLAAEYCGGVKKKSVCFPV